MDARGANTGVFRPPPLLMPASIGCGDCGSKAFLEIAAKTSTHTVEVHQPVNRHCWGLLERKPPESFARIPMNHSLTFRAAAVFPAILRPPCHMPSLRILSDVFRW